MQIAKAALCALLCLTVGAGVPQTAPRPNPQDVLPPPVILEHEALLAGNPLATYAAMCEKEDAYRKSPFAPIYPEMRHNFAEFLGYPLAGVEAMGLPSLRTRQPSGEARIPDSFRPEGALAAIEREARKTRIVVFGEEHHLPQTRSLYERMLRSLWRLGYRYLAAETFSDPVIAPGTRYPDYRSGYYLMDPVYASAVRTALKLGYHLVPYDTHERGPAGDQSFRDRTQAESITARIFDRDSKAKALILVGRAHAAEVPAADGWAPMASVLKKITGIDPLTLYAPAMTERLTPDQENPLYRDATARGMVTQPIVFVDRRTGRLMDAGSFDAFVFWPRVKLVNGRPDWMETTLGRRAVEIPEPLRKGEGLRLVQAFAEDEPSSAIPVDQIVLEGAADAPALMLPPGRFRVRAIDRHSRVLAEITLSPKAPAGQNNRPTFRPPRSARDTGYVRVAKCR